MSGMSGQGLYAGVRRDYRKAAGAVLVFAGRQATRNINLAQLKSCGIGTVNPRELQRFDRTEVVKASHWRVDISR
jgi:hypothetical protein